jgi:hypothetical protein
MHPVIARYASLALPLVIVIAGAGSASACGTGRLVLEDKFNTLDPAWSIEKKYTKLTAGPDGLTIVVPAGKDVGALNQFGAYKNFELCIWVVAEKADPAADDLFAVRFWTPDGNDEYWAVTWTGKSRFVVNRYVDGKPTAITAQINNSSLLHSGAVNEFSVSVNGNKGAFSTNGQKVTDFTGQPPDNGSIFGFLVSANQSNPSTFVLKDLQLREVEAAQP